MNFLLRNASSLSANANKIILNTNKEKAPPKLVKIFLSSSQCIYENLAFEEWIFRNHNLMENGDALIVWRNTPTVVIGRYQNPWIEANVCYCRENGIKLARRHSGGGAVYHDLGNLNISILTSHDRHSRRNNLEKLATQLNADLPLLSPSLVVANSRDDLIIEPGGSKISGTAARISHGRAYHHLTLLVDANLEKLRFSLQSPMKEKIETTATRSIRAKTVGCISQKLAVSYSSSEELMDVVKTSVMKSFTSQYEMNESIEWDGVLEGLPGIEKEVKQLKSDEWIFGKTPKFSLQLLDSHTDDLRRIYVENGKIKESSNSEFPAGRQFHKAFLLSRYSELFRS